MATQNNQEELLNILSTTTNWISAKELATMLNVSERTIRNYIARINKSHDNLIETSRNGYKITNKKTSSSTMQDEVEKRVYHLLSQLLTSKDGVSIFDESESLNVSESTIANNVIPKIKEMIKPFDLQIKSANYQYYLVGKEQNKRKLIGHLVTNNHYGFFTSNETLKNLFPNSKTQEAFQSLAGIFQASHLFINDYALNNLLVHVLIILIRLESKDTLNTLDFDQNIDDLLANFNQKIEIIELANNISDFFKTEFGQSIPEKDYQQILILIALSIDHEVTHLENIIDEDFIQNIHLLLDSLSKRYNIDTFSSDFILQFSLHMYNAKQRSSFKISYPNPIARQIKTDYAPIYDMAVFFAHKFSKQYRVDLSEDEIAFIAFHIGAYLENNKKKNSKITCSVIVENYHGFSKKLITDLQNTFGTDIIIQDVLPVGKYLESAPACDLLLTTVPINKPQEHIVLINPILTKQNIRQIWDEIEKIEENQNREFARLFLQNLLHDDLYFRNISFNTKEEYIEFMGNHCIEKGYIQPDFIKDVILRESVSSTAFTDCLAVPHAISNYADQSFICVVHNDSLIPWGTKTVRFILMIGISEHDMRYFKNAFDLIISIFCSTERTLKILNTNNFDEFKKEMK